MTKRDYMIEYRQKHGLSVVDMAIKCKTKARIIRMLEDCDQEITHPKIAERVGKAYKLTKKTNRRAHAGNPPQEQPQL